MAEPAPVVPESGSQPSEAPKPDQPKAEEPKIEALPTTPQPAVEPAPPAAPAPPAEPSSAPATATEPPPTTPTPTGDFSSPYNEQPEGMNASPSAGDILYSPSSGVVRGRPRGRPRLHPYPPGRDQEYVQKVVYPSSASRGRGSGSKRGRRRKRDHNGDSGSSDEAPAEDSGSPASSDSDDSVGVAPARPYVPPRGHSGPYVKRRPGRPPRFPGPNAGTKFTVKIPGRGPKPNPITSPLPGGIPPPTPEELERLQKEREWLRQELAKLDN